MHSQFKMNALSILSLAAVWEIAGRMADSMLIPPLTQIAAAWYKLLLGGKLLPISAPASGPWSPVFSWRS